MELPGVGHIELDGNSLSLPPLLVYLAPRHLIQLASAAQLSVYTTVAMASDISNHFLWNISIEQCGSTSSPQAVRVSTHPVTPACSLPGLQIG